MSLVSTSRELLWLCEVHPEVVQAAPGVCPRDGRALSLRTRAMAHGDHNPRHVGTLFMAPDGFHHLEGALDADSVLRLYFYDDFTRPVDARGFRARLGDRELQAARDGSCLEIALAERETDPLELALQVRFDPASDREEHFDFIFTSQPESGADRITTGTPSDPEELIEAIVARGRRVDELVRRGAWPDLFIPALEAKDLALALEERERDKVALAVKTIVRAAWLLDLYGDLGKKAEVEAAQRLFATGIEALKRAHGR